MWPCLLLFDVLHLKALASENIRLFGLPPRATACLKVQNYFCLKDNKSYFPQLKTGNFSILHEFSFQCSQVETFLQIQLKSLLQFIFCRVADTIILQTKHKMNYIL